MVALHLRIDADRGVAPGLEESKKMTLGGDAGHGFGVVDVLQNFAGSVVALEDLHRDGALSGGGKKFGGVEKMGLQGVPDLGGEGAVGLVAEAEEAGFGENGAVEFGLVGDFLKASGDVAADVDDFEVGAKVAQLQLPAHGRGADGSSDGEFA